MKILIVGSKGFIGAHCVDYFSELGYQVTGADVLPALSGDGTNYIDLNRFADDYNGLFKITDFDFCINAAGSAHVAYSFQYPEKDFELNVSLVIKLLGAIKNHSPQCKFLNFSSAAVYGNPLSLPIAESAETKPLSPYGYHKLLSENLLLEYHRFFKLKTCSLRIFSAYGEGLKKQLFWDLFQKSKSDDRVYLFGTGKESRDFIYILDLLQILQLIMEKAEFNGEVYNVANGEEITIDTAVGEFYKALGWTGTVHFSGEEKLGDPVNWKADIRQLTALGYKRKYSFEEGILNYCKWLNGLN